MAEDSGQTVPSCLESHVVPLVPGLADRLAAGIRVLDVGCGSGRVLNHVAARYSRSRFTGVDLSPEGIAFARAESAARKLTNTEFVVRDLSDFDATAPADEFDLVTTFDAIHDQAQPLRVLRGIRRALKRDGLYLMQDIRASRDVRENAGHPLGTFLYTASSCTACRCPCRNEARASARCGAKRRRSSTCGKPGSPSWRPTACRTTSRTPGTW